MRLEAELQLRRLSYTSNNASSATFALHDEDWEKLKGCEGKRFMAVMVEIGDDEQPLITSIDEEKKSNKAKGLGLLAIQWCKNELFWEWCGMPSEEMAREYVLKACGVEHRNMIDESERASHLFNNWIRIPFSEWLKDQRRLAQPVETLER